MLPVVLATLAVIAPGGWVEDREPAPLAQVASETQRFHAPDDPESVYVVSRLEYVGSSTIAEIANRYVPPPGDSQTRDIDGMSIVDFRRIAPDGRRAHLRVLTTADPGALVGFCVGRGAAFRACEEKLDTLSIGRTHVDSTSTLKIVGWGFLALVMLAAIGVGIRALLRRRELARSPTLLDGELVTISGVARPVAKALESPLSGKSCVLYQAHARLLGGGAVLGECSDTEIAAFEVETRRGTIQVAAELDLAVTPTTVVDTNTPRQLAFRAKHGVAPTASVAFDEIVVAPGSKVTLRGVVRRELTVSAAERGYRDAPDVLCLVGRPSERVQLLKIW